MKHKNIRRMTTTAIMAALICVIAPISIPLSGGVPISLGPFIVMLSGALLGPWMGTEATLVYLLLGAVGVPVFSGMTGGIGHLIGPTGGYLLGYLFLAFFTGLIYSRWGREKTGFRKYSVMVLGMLIGMLFEYSFGTAWFVYSTKTALQAALTACVYPFLPLDALKIAVVALVTPRLEKPLQKIMSEKRKKASV